MIEKRQASLFPGICREIRKKFIKNSTKFQEIEKIENSIIQSRKNVDDFWLKFEFVERCKGVHCVDPGESFQTHILLQIWVSIQPRTSPPEMLIRSATFSRCGRGRIRSKAAAGTWQRGSENARTGGASVPGPAARSSPT